MQGSLIQAPAPARTNTSGNLSLDFRIRAYDIMLKSLCFIQSTYKVDVVPLRMPNAETFGFR